MKKVTATILFQGREKTVEVWLDEKTLGLLNECKDEKIKQEYIAEEYKAQLIERRETRRHQSLEYSMENGFDIADENANVEEDMLKQISNELLYKAINQLEPQQKWLIKQIYYLNRTQVSVADELQIDATSIRDRLKKIYKKMQKNLK